MPNKSQIFAYSASESLFRLFHIFCKTKVLNVASWEGLGKKCAATLYTRIDIVCVCYMIELNIFLYTLQYKQILDFSPPKTKSKSDFFIVLYRENVEPSYGKVI